MAYPLIEQKKNHGKLMTTFKDKSLATPSEAASQNESSKETSLTIAQIALPQIATYVAGLAVWIVLIIVSTFLSFYIDPFLKYFNIELDVKYHNYIFVFMLFAVSILSLILGALFGVYIAKKLGVPSNQKEDRTDQNRN